MESTFMSNSTQRRPSDILEGSYNAQHVHNSSRNSSLSSQGSEGNLDYNSMQNGLGMSVLINWQQDGMLQSSRTPLNPALFMHPLDTSMLLQDWNGQRNVDSVLYNDLKQPADNSQPRQPTNLPLNQPPFLQQNTNMNNNNHHIINGIMPRTPPPPTPLAQQYNPYFSLNSLAGQPSMHSMQSSSSSSSSNSISPPMKKLNDMGFELNSTKANGRRHSEDSHQPRRTYNKRAFSHPSVASRVSLTNSEPIAKTIDGIEHIYFLYSHDRLAKQYTIRTDIQVVNLDAIDMNFRVQNAIYPRANVDRSEYDGNRWDYETSCNQLGWKLCWLNRDQLYGRRGLIQRAVDSYRNRHPDMRSRRVARQEKVANGTLRKRKSKKLREYSL